MAGPGDEMAAGTDGRGRPRASHDDREQVIEVLKVAFVHAHPADQDPSDGARQGIGEQEEESGRGALLLDRRNGRRAGRNAADTGRVAFCRTARRHVRLGRSRADRLASSAARMA